MQHVNELKRCTRTNYDLGFVHVVIGMNFDLSTKFDGTIWIGQRTTWRVVKKRLARNEIETVSGREKP